MIVTSYTRVKGERPQKFVFNEEHKNKKFERKQNEKRKTDKSKKIKTLAKEKKGVENGIT